jgi:CheY-like chemotaxis protein
MSKLLENAEFWKAITGLAWPLVVLFVFFRFGPVIVSLLKRENVSIKVGNLELSVQDAAKNIGRSIADLQERLSSLETQQGATTPKQSSIIENALAENSIRSRVPQLIWVDDYPSNNAFLIEAMKDRGIDVTLSLSTEDAIKCITSKHFDFLITDLGRKENGSENPFAGLDLLKRLRAIGSELPVLVFAGKRGLENERILIEAGAEAVTTSGVDVMAFVERHLR